MAARTPLSEAPDRNGVWLRGRVSVRDEIALPERELQLPVVPLVERVALIKVRERGDGASPGREAAFGSEVVQPTFGGRPSQEECCLRGACQRGPRPRGPGRRMTVGYGSGHWGGIVEIQVTADQVPGGGDLLDLLVALDDQPDERVKVMLDLVVDVAGLAIVNTIIRNASSAVTATSGADGAATACHAAFRAAFLEFRRVRPAEDEAQRPSDHYQRARRCTQLATL